MIQLSASFVWTSQISSFKILETATQRGVKVPDEDSEIRLQKGEGVSEKFHNSVVGHLGYDRTYKALKILGHNWLVMKDLLKMYISECTIYQKIKWKRSENWKDIADHHLYSVSPLSQLSIDTLGLLPEDESGMR